MTPETSSNTAVDWEDLSDFLLSDRAPDTCMRPAEVDGFVTGIAVSPDMIPPSDWLPVIWGGGEPEFKSIEETSRVLSLVLRHHSNIRLTLDRTPEAYQPVLLDSSTGQTTAEDWARGFFAAVTLRGASWAALLVPEQFGLIAPIAVHWSNQEGLPLVPGSAEHIAEIQERAVGLLPAAVIAIDQFWKGRRHGALPPTGQTVSGSTAKVGRNDPCPCGSGKKYKRCCGP
jgi:uncharacterized protein